ncbi:MAG: DUF3048 domain-containing protein [Candidatus Kerfeldbacteria bacterium]|nr:DUF3048 domain-containing protein [Candidatus Kerfeldbacteria bacterium]
MTRKFLYLFLATVIGCGGFVVPSYAATKAKAKPAPKVKVYPPPKATGPLTQRKLDGVYVKQSVANTWPIAIMIDNHTSARPQSGLAKASVVYETLAEGGIPRFMAIFADTTVPSIGPVRSTRPYFVQEAAEYNAAMAHAGGSPDGLKLLTQLRMPNIEGIKGTFAKYFYRANGGGVHGLYTNMAKLWDAIGHTKIAKVKPLYQSWKFTDELALAQRPGGTHGATIDLGYGKKYVVEYRYDRKKNVYNRFTGGAKQTDRNTKQQVTTKNVVILNVPKEKVLDRKGRLDIKVTGKGTGYLLQNGKVIRVTWSKPSTRARTVLKTTDGKEVQFVRGQIWITIVPQGHKYKVS